MFCRVFVENKSKQNQQNSQHFSTTKHNKRCALMSFAERFKKLRGIETQKAFAEKLGITPQAVLNYEKYGRIPKGRYLANICQKLGVREQWLLSGEGPMRMDEKEAQAGDTSPVLPAFLSAQLIENIASEKNKTGDMSPVLPLSRETQELYRRMLELQERLLSLTEQNADLRLQLERRDLRIRELEKENAGLREAQKGAARLYCSHTGDAG